MSRSGYVKNGGRRCEANLFSNSLQEWSNLRSGIGAASTEVAEVAMTSAAAAPVGRTTVAGLFRRDLVEIVVVNPSAIRPANLLHCSNMPSGSAFHSVACNSFVFSSCRTISDADQSCGATFGTTVLVADATPQRGGTGPSTTAVLGVDSGDNVRNPGSVVVFDGATDSASGRYDVELSPRMEN